MKNEPVAWMREDGVIAFHKKKEVDSQGYKWIPLYAHPVKEQLSNGHLSDCAVHNEPASRNKPCDCGFEPKFNLLDLKHEDNCRYFDDDLFCTCGAEDSALVEWYRHKEVTRPVKELTNEEIDIALYVADITLNNLSDGDIPIERINAFARAILRKASE